MQTIGIMIRSCRKRSGVTQIELARMAGVGKTAVFDIENGKQGIRLNTLLRVLAILNIKVELHDPFGNVTTLPHPSQTTEGETDHEAR